MVKRSHRRKHRSLQNGFFLSFIDGLEGGFAIFAGIVTGLSFTTIERELLIATALVGIVVNATNAATIRYSSEHYMDELDGHEKRSAYRSYFLPSLLEFIVYLVVSSLALLPLILIDNIISAILVMIASCLVILFAAGAIRGALLGRHWLRDGVEIATGGVIMISVGVIAGWLLSQVLAI